MGLHPIFRNFPEIDRFMLARMVSTVSALRCGFASGMLPFPWNPLAKCSLFTALVRLECFYQVSCTLGWLMDFQFVLSSLISCFLKSRHCQAFQASFWTNSLKIQLNDEWQRSPTSWSMWLCVLWRTIRREETALVAKTEREREREMMMTWQVT